MKNSLLKAAIFASGLLCFYGFLAIRFEPLFNLVNTEKNQTGYWDDHERGELYYFNNVWDFLEELPPALPKYQYSAEHPDLEDAEILTFGDSYLDFSRHVQLSKRLTDSLKVKVFYAYTTSPQKLLADNNYKKSSKKILVYERTERWIPYTFGEDGDILDNTPNPSNKDSETFFLIKYSKKVLHFFFNNRSEELYSALLHGSYLFGYINSAISTLKFRWFGYVSSFTPEYVITEDRPWLFFHDQLGNTKSSYYYQFTDNEIEQIANKIFEFSTALKDNYNLELVFMPIPSKFTIYHELVDSITPYNLFLTRLFKSLDKKGVNYVDLYNPYLNTGEYVFYGTDEHWTEDGVAIATEELLTKLNQMATN